jgi:GTP:adenosylcobinamide-phosphate guanylyltransferase
LPPEPFTAIILAAQRAGVIDPLAAEASISHKCLVPIEGWPLIAHVASALQATPGIARLRIVVEKEVVPIVAAIMPSGPAPIDYVDPADNLADSVHAAARGVEQPMLVTTADNVLLTPGAVTAILDTISAGADAAFAMATRESVLAAHPLGQRRFYRFADDSFSNCNLYAFAGPKALAAVESFRSGGQFAKKPLRLIAAVGVFNLALLLLHRISLRGAARRLSRRFRLKIEPVILADGAHAIDVDNRRTYDAAALLLAQRRADISPSLIKAI